MEENKPLSSKQHKIRSELSAFFSNINKKPTLKFDLLLFAAFISLVVLLVQ